MNEQEYDWMSVSTLAKELGVSEQTIRNRCRAGVYETMTFQRGRMNGILIKRPNEHGK